MVMSTTRPSALVTGASGAIGSAICSRLATLGYDLIVLGRRQRELMRVADQIEKERSVRVEALAVDLEQDSSFTTLAGWLEARSTPDVFVHAAGDGPVGDALTASDAAWRRTLNVKLISAVRLVRLLLPGMQRRGSGNIIFINGTFAFTPHEAFTVNAAVNGALRGYAKALARQAGRRGVTVNSIHPGITASNLWDATLAALVKATGGDSATLSAQLLEQVPIGRFARPEEIAGAVAYLVSKDAAGLNGASINVDGGACVAA
jgi:NAD(P)-dependent dehydrogenase (short-subunit alcohol dehydrogenase family)